VVCLAGALTTGVCATVAASATGNVLLSALTANAAQDTATVVERLADTDHVAVEGLHSGESRDGS
jgi:hypothetical protein